MNVIRKNPEAGDPVGEAPAHLNSRYRRLALVSMAGHLDALDQADTDTLVVSCCWLLWQRAAAEGRHCLHYEQGFQTIDEAKLGTDIYLRTQDWSFVDGKDITLFQGASLARKFTSEVNQVIIESERLGQTLLGLIERFGPEEIVFHDFRSEIAALDRNARFSLVERVAGGHGIPVIDRRDSLPDSAADMPLRKLHITTAPPPVSLKQRIRETFLRLLDETMARLSTLTGFLAGGKPRILFLTTQLNGLPLLNRHEGRDISFLYPAPWFPMRKKPAAFLKYLFQGNRLFTFMTPRLTKTDIATVEAVEQQVKDNLSRVRQSRWPEVANFVENQIIGGRRLYDTAAQVKGTNDLLDAYAPDAVLTDAFLNLTSVTTLEMAKTRNIPTAITWHAPFIQQVKFPVLGCEPRAEGATDYFFSWGASTDKYLDGVSARGTKIRTGSLPAKWATKKLSPASGAGGVLVLQYSAPKIDPLWPWAGQYRHFVETVRMLNDLGYTDVRYKLHPGQNKPSYYKQIAEFYGLKCEVYLKGKFLDFVEWADFVIGPVHSGAMLETMAVGRPYFPVLLHPHVLGPDLENDYTVYSDVDSLRQALEKGTTPDNTRLFEDFTSLGSIPDPAGRVLDALADIVCPKQ